MVEGPAASMLVEASEGADLLVVGSRGHGGFHGLLLGSVSQQCAHHARCPVVIVPSPERAQAAPRNSVPRRGSSLAPRLGPASGSPAGAAGSTRDVLLRDGTTLRLHRPRADEADALVAFFSRLSPQSLYYRFHGMPSVGPPLVAPFLDPDGVDRDTFVGSLSEDGEERIVAVASWARLRDPATAEVAFAVEDALQGKGVGTRLLEQLAATAGSVGIDELRR